MKPFVSLCMIVKNEEKVLGRCLESVKENVDEIVIVDTGSTDSTKEIASNYTDKIYDFKWTDSFADARNFAQSKATGEWILVLDADEYCDSENLKTAIHELKTKDKDIDAYEVKIYNFTGYSGESIVQNVSIRLYRNDETIGYYRAIHEQVSKKEGELKTDVSSLVLYHSGYLVGVIKSKQKNERNSKLIDKEIKTSGNSAFDYFNLGNEYRSVGNVEKALESYINAYKNKPDIRYSWVAFAIVQIINCLCDLHRYLDALHVIGDAELLYPTSPDFKFFRAKVYFDQHRFDDAAVVLEEVIENKDKYQYCITSVDFLEYRPHQMLGLIYKHKNDNDKAVYHFAKALSKNKFCNVSLFNLIEILTNNCSLAEVESFIQNNEFITNENELCKFIKLFISLSQFDLANQYIQKLKNDGLIHHGFAMKLQLVQGNYSMMDEFFKTDTINNLNLLINKGCLDFYDLVLYSLTTNDSDRIASLLISLINDEEKKQLLNFLFNSQKPSKIIKNDLLELVERTLQVKNIKWFTVLAQKIDAFPAIYQPVGHLLYQYNFKNEAVQIYSKIKNTYYEEQTFVNLIEYHSSNGNFLVAKDLITESIEIGYTDFRIFEYALKLDGYFAKTDGWNINEIVNNAFSHYPGSQSLGLLYNLVQQQSQGNKGNSNQLTVGFFLETTFHYYVYESIINELLNKGVNCHLVINDYFQEQSETSYMYDDLMSFIQSLDRNDIEAFAVSMVKESQFKYDCMVSCYYSVHLNEIANKHVRVMYGLAKDNWNFSWWNVFYDKILCYGNYDYRKLNIDDNSVIIGNPKFDKWFRKEFDIERTKEKLLIDENKKTILYAPTYGHLSSIDDWIDDVKALNDDYNIIIKMHHGTAYRESETYRREMIMSSFKNITSDPSDLLSLFAISDFVITDNSGIIFDAILAEKNILLLNTNYNTSHKDMGNEIKIRETIINLDKGYDLRRYLENESIFKRQKDKLSSIVSNMYHFRDGNSGSRAADEIIRLLNQEQSATEENKFLYSLRRRVFGI
ncbi:glycosyltransferase [Bacillus ginsengihumi]|uniref:Glycosyltransferase n=1 Tax=Heyndrickxia ginsengihumi TaxID=363870 RepID=A0A6M0P394_9BACI|nr:glycosyltransferase [Heyndrickxia ginsengihumi]NEY19166.1 glycosyltransferase [Heyndrickxia ginsengihumi]